MPFNKSENCTSEFSVFVVNCVEEVLSPLYECKLSKVNQKMECDSVWEFAHRIDCIDAFTALILLTLYPVPVQVREQTVDVVSPRRISIPLFCVVSYKLFVHEVVRTLKQRVSAAPEATRNIKVHHPPLEQL